MSKVLGEAKPGERLSRARQRQKLIDACITALHQHGPSRTTIDKVVTIADMSPGIVNFYFETKAALLVAALEHLAVEFETLVLEPLAALRHTPMVALDRLIDLYLDPDVASARKVSVWYSFWGESSSRREYFTICGKRDVAFAALVQDLMARAIQQTGLEHLDADAMALGLIGCLEMMWQEIAFQDEAELDRETAKRRCRAYLRSVFAGHFGAGDAAAGASGDSLEAWLGVFRRSWQFACSVADIPRAGDYVAWWSAVERVVVVRGAGGAIGAFVNTCLHRPHLLVGGDAGHLDGAFVCQADGAVYGLDGVRRSGGVLRALHVAVQDSMVFVTHAAEAAGDVPRIAVRDVAPLSVSRQVDVAADWKLVVEHWADAYFDTDARGVDGAATAVRDAGGASVTRRWAKGGDAAALVERRLIWPNLFVETRPDGVTIRQVLPLADGRSRVRVRCHGAAGCADEAWEQQDLVAMETTQPGGVGAEGGAAVRAFAAWCASIVDAQD